MVSVLNSTKAEITVRLYNHFRIKKREHFSRSKSLCKGKTQKTKTGRGKGNIELGRGKGKTILICRCHDCLCRNTKEPTKLLARLQNTSLL